MNVMTRIAMISHKMHALIDYMNVELYMYYAGFIFRDTVVNLVRPQCTRGFLSSTGTATRVRVIGRARVARAVCGARV